MIELLRREFTVQLPIEQAWQHLARLEQLPSWARHIRQVYSKDLDNAIPRLIHELNANTPSD